MIKILGKKLFLLLFVCFTGLTVHAGSVESTVDETEVERGDSVLFSITVVGEESDPLPEMEEIDGVTIDQITRNKGSDFVYVDGKSVMQHTTTVTYEFKPPYNMTIPAFQVMVDGKVKMTNAINLKVVKPIAGSKRKNKYFSLDIKLNKSTAYVGEPIVATVYFRQNAKINLMQLDYEKPAFSSFFSKQLEGENTYKEGADTVHELNYLLIPKKEGKIAVEPATAKVAQRVQERQAGGWFANVPKWSNIASPSLSIEVKKPTSAYDIGGSFKLNASVDAQRVKANKPVNLKIELEGEGSLEEFSGIEFNLPEVTVYSDEAKVKSEFDGKKLKSTYVKSFAFIADHDFTIPSKEIRLFNYKTGAVEILKTKPYRVKVEGGKQAASELEVLSVVDSKNVVKKEIETEAEEEKVFTLDKFKNVSPDSLLLGLMFLFGALSAFFVQFLVKYLFSGRKRKRQGFNGHEALQILYPHMGESAEVEMMVRQLYAIKNGEKKIKIDREELKRLLKLYTPNKKSSAF